MRAVCALAAALSLSLSTAAVAQAPKPAVKAAPAKAAKKPTKAEEDAAAAEAERVAAEARATEAAAAATADADKAAAAATATAAAAAEDARAQQARSNAAREATGLDARMRVLAEGLAVALKRLPGDHREQRFAVVPFENVGDEAQQKSLGLVVSDLVVTDLARDHRLPMIERTQLGAVMNELALQQSGAVDDAKALQVGKLAGARALVVGRVSDGGDVFVVSARAVDAETGAVIVAEDVKLPKAELVAFSANAVVLKSKSGAMFRSVVLPGWGQSYNGDDAKGLVLGALTIGLGVSTVVAGGLGVYNGFIDYPTAHLREPAKSLSAAEKGAYIEGLRTTADAQLTAAAVLAGATAVAWVVTVADAYVSGVDVESLDAAMAKN
jgi:TolB-like protein